MNNQNQNQQKMQAQNQNMQNQNIQNTQNYNAMTNMEAGSELTQSAGEISRILATQKLTGLEIGKLGENLSQKQKTQNQNTQLEVDQSQGQMSQNLSQQSKS